MKTLVRLGLVLVLCVPLVTPASYARGAAVRPAPAAASWWGEAVSWLLQLGAKAGICIDPNGATCASAVIPTSDHGICIDPDGATCASSARTSADAGGCIDPDGQFCAGS